MFFLVYVLDWTDSLSVSFWVQILCSVIEYKYKFSMGMLMLFM